MPVNEFLNMCKNDEWYSIHIWKGENRIFRGDCVTEISNDILAMTVESFSVDLSCCDELLTIHINVG